MKIKIFLLILILAGCSADNKIDSNEYIQAGMFDEAENYYQKLILKEDDSEVKDLWKYQLLLLYINSGQMDKADRYASMYSINDTNVYAGSLSMLANSYFDRHNFLRAIHFFNLSAVHYKLASKKRNSNECNLGALGAHRGAYFSAKFGEYIEDAEEQKEAALEIIDSVVCMTNQEAQSQRNFFD